MCIYIYIYVILLQELLADDSRYLKHPPKKMTNANVFDQRIFQNIFAVFTL